MRSALLGWVRERVVLRRMFCVRSGSRADVIGHTRVRLDSRTWRRCSVALWSSCQPSPTCQAQPFDGLSGQFGDQVEILVDVQHGELRQLRRRGDDKIRDRGRSKGPWPSALRTRLHQRVRPGPLRRRGGRSPHRWHTPDHTRCFGACGSTCPRSTGTAWSWPSIVKAGSHLFGDPRRKRRRRSVRVARIVVTVVMRGVFWAPAGSWGFGYPPTQQCRRQSRWS